MNESLCRFRKTYICFKKTHINYCLFALLNITSEHMWILKMKYSDTIFRPQSMRIWATLNFVLCATSHFAKRFFNIEKFSRIIYFIDNGTSRRIVYLNKIIIFPRKLFNRLPLSWKHYSFFNTAHALRIQNTQNSFDIPKITPLN